MACFCQLNPMCPALQNASEAFFLVATLATPDPANRFLSEVVSEPDPLSEPTRRYGIDAPLTLAISVFVSSDGLILLTQPSVF